MKDMSCSLAAHAPKMHWVGTGPQARVQHSEVTGLAFGVASAGESRTCAPPFPGEVSQSTRVPARGADENLELFCLGGILMP